MTTALFALVLFAAPSAEPFYVDSEIGVDFPEKIGDFAADTRKEYSGKALGYSIRYRSSRGATLDLYVFDAGLKNIEDGKSGRDLKTLFDQALGDVRHVEKLGHYKNVKDSEVGKAFSETVTSGFLCTKLTYQLLRKKTEPGREMISYLFGSGHNRKMLKIRCTVPADRNVEKELNGFLEALLKLLDKSGRLA